MVHLFREYKCSNASKVIIALFFLVLKLGPCENLTTSFSKEPTMKRFSLLLIATFVCNMTMHFDASAMELQQNPSYRSAFVEWTSNVRKTPVFRALSLGIGAGATATLLLYVWEEATIMCTKNSDENSFCEMVNSINYTGKYVYAITYASISYLFKSAVEQIIKTKTQGVKSEFIRHWILDIKQIDENDCFVCKRYHYNGEGESSVETSCQKVACTDVFKFTE